MCEILKYKNPYPNIEGLALRVTHNIQELEMNFRDRADDNSSGFTFSKNISLYMTSLTSFSLIPLRFSIICGLVFSISGFLYGFYIIIKKTIIGIAMPIGFPSILSFLLFSSGMIMIILGVIGEYIGRIYNSLNAAPQFVIKNSVNLDNECKVNID